MVNSQWLMVNNQGLWFWSTVYGQRSRVCGSGQGSVVLVKGLWFWSRVYGQVSMVKSQGSMVNFIWSMVKWYLVKGLQRTSPGAL